MEKDHLISIKYNQLQTLLGMAHYYRLLIKNRKLSSSFTLRFLEIQNVQTTVRYSVLS